MILLRRSLQEDGLPPDGRPERDGTGIAPAWVRAIEAASDAAGRSAAWLVLAMVLLGAYNAVARHAGRSLGVPLGSNAWIELQWYLFALVVVFCAAWTLRHDAHVRVDVWYGRLSPAGRARVDLAGTVLFLLPFTAFVLWVSWPSVRASWAVHEGSPDPGGLPRYPLKSAIVAGFALLLLQGLASGWRSWAAARRGGEG
jgi:TRAP-type mannitol/chloroaromatic compound transport system permease small subunit